MKLAEGNWEWQEQAAGGDWCPLAGISDSHTPALQGLSTHLHDLLLADPMEAQLSHGIHWLPFLGLLGCHQQVGDFCKAGGENILKALQRNRTPPSQ